MKLTIKINNQIKKLDILYTLHSDNSKKDYLLCSNLDDENDSDIYAFIYYPNDKSKGVELIKSEDDWNEIKNFIKDEELALNVYN